MAGTQLLSALLSALLYALLSALLPAAATEVHNHGAQTDDSFHVSAGHLFLLKCLFVDAHATVTWSRGGGASLPPGVEVRNGLLWFLPVQMSHAGAYTCEKRDHTGSLSVTFGVSVSTAKCPDPPETKSIAVGVTELVSCKQREVLELNLTRSIRWVKDCQLTAPAGQRASVSESGFMMLSRPSQEDSGKYTCLVDLSVDGRTYTAARSIRLVVNKDISTTLIVEPRVFYPQQEVVLVEEGSRAELSCSAYIGFSDDDETLMFWTVNETHTEDQQGLEVSLSL
ncbi:Interleukin-1 receptor type 2 [Liparis tanakae]|uniref:Interleukin-1 receptor type 2 n=1 Tax=Liparis tanakae TaxID=230148 RepID=A0A4Z2F5N2_9TELE|nr:Interleukin-1 receptor type 2 [Liparis tanakae]